MQKIPVSSSRGGQLSLGNLGSERSSHLTRDANIYLEIDADFKPFFGNGFLDGF